MGVFQINQLDAARLRHGMHEVESRDPERAAQIRERVRQSRARLVTDFLAIPKPEFWLKTNKRGTASPILPMTSLVPCWIPKPAPAISTNIVQ
jgi:hypothetical protein